MPHVKSQTEHNGVFCINIILILLLLLSGDVHPNICGDYNIDLLKYDCYQNGKHFVNQLFSYGFYPLIKSPTDVTGITSTLIDNIYTNEIGVHLENDIMVNDISDHLPNVCLLEYKNVKRKSA